MTPIDLRPWRWLRAGTALLLWLGLSAGAARAQVEVHGVSVTLDPCVPIDRAHFAQLLAIELGDALDYEHADRASGPLASVSLGCVAPTDARGLPQIKLELEDALTRKRMARVIDLRPVDDRARDRLMALTVAEFVLASWAELRLVKAESFEPAGPAPPAALEQRAQHWVDEHSEASGSELAQAPADWSSRHSGLQLGAAGELFSFAPAFRFVPSLTLHVTLPAWRVLALRLGAQLGVTSLPGRAGEAGETVEVRALLASLLALLMHVEPLGRFDLNIGAGLRGGVIHWTAPRVPDSSLEPASAIALWAGPLVALGTSYRASPQLRVGLMVEAGILGLRPRALAPHASVVTELKGLWTGASLGIDWEF